MKKIIKKDSILRFWISWLQLFGGIICAFVFGKLTEMIFPLNRLIVIFVVCFTFGLSIDVFMRITGVSMPSRRYFSKYYNTKATKGFKRIFVDIILITLISCAITLVAYFKIK